MFWGKGGGEKEKKKRKRESKEESLKKKIIFKRASRTRIKYGINFFSTKS